MDYRKTIKLYEEDGKTVMCDFDIVLNRSMAVKGLKGYTNLVDVLFNGVGFDVEDGEPSDVIMQLIEEGKADRLFPMICPICLKICFPKCLMQEKSVRVAERTFLNFARSALNTTRSSSRA